ncbi:MAG: hypothetical protein WCG93_12900 [Paludibacter sp.]
MAKQTLSVLKAWFAKGLKPTASQFSDMFDSFFHKDDKVPAASVDGLQDLLDAKASTDALGGYWSKDEQLPGANVGAADVSYSNTTYPTVEKALDKLLYVTPSVSSFVASIASAEKGQTIDSLSLTWAVSKTMTTQTIDQSVGDVVGLLTKALTAQGIVASKTWTITVGDGTNTATKTVTLTFYNKRYWGVSALETLTDAQIIALSSEFSTSRAQSRTLDATGGRYLYFVMPEAFACTTAKFKLGGLYMSDWQVTTRSFINASGYSESYMIFRSTNLQTGAAMAVDII